MSQLEGSEKQIKWATAIKEEKIKELNDLKEKIKGMKDSTLFILYRRNDNYLESCFPKYRKNIKNTSTAKEWITKKIDETIKEIEDITSARYIIGLRNTNDINLVFSIFNPFGEYIKILKKK